MNKLRNSKLGIVFIVLAMLGLTIGPALALGCCCASPVASHHHKAPSAMDDMPCCHKAAPQVADNHCAPQNQNAPVISHHCPCPHADAALFVNNSTPQTGVFATHIMALPVRDFTFAAPQTIALPFAASEVQRPPRFTLSSFSDRAPPVC